MIVIVVTNADFIKQTAANLVKELARKKESMKTWQQKVAAATLRGLASEIAGDDAEDEPSGEDEGHSGGEENAQVSGQYNNSIMCTTAHSCQLCQTMHQRLYISCYHDSKVNATRLRDKCPLWTFPCYQEPGSGQACENTADGGEVRELEELSDQNPQVRSVLCNRELHNFVFAFLVETQAWYK